MSFKPISVEKKIEAVSRVISGNKIQPVAREIGVHRSSVYTWRERALNALEQALEPRKRGPKFKHPQKTPERNLREEIDKLKACLKEKERQIYLLKQKLEPQGDDSKPVRCPNRGCEKVYRNSTYKIRPKGFFDNLKTYKEELIQRFICPYCKIRKDNTSMPLFMDNPIKIRNDFEEYKQYYNDNIEKRLPKNWDEIVKRLKSRNFLVRLGGNPYGFFGFLRYLMGFKNLLIKMYDDPKLIKDANEFFLNYVIKAWSKILKDVEVDCAYIWEDMAYNNGLMISPAMFREFLSPYYKRMVSFLKENGVDIILVDSDGYIEELVPLMKETGVTGLWPWEIQAGNNLLRVRKNYPDLQIIGGVDKFILRKDKNTIDKELEKISYLLKKGRFIPHIDHLIPPDAKWENFKYCREKLNEMIDEK